MSKIDEKDPLLKKHQELSLSIRSLLYKFLNATKKEKEKLTKHYIMLENEEDKIIEDLHITKENKDTIINRYIYLQEKSSLDTDDQEMNTVRFKELIEEIFYLNPFLETNNLDNEKEIEMQVLNDISNYNIKYIKKMLINETNEETKSYIYYSLINLIHSNRHQTNNFFGNSQNDLPGKYKCLQFNQSPELIVDTYKTLTDKLIKGDVICALSIADVDIEESEINRVDLGLTLLDIKACLSLQSDSEVLDSFQSFKDKFIEKDEMTTLRQNCNIAMTKINETFTNELNKRKINNKELIKK